jgi:hypothetical protein
MMCGGCYNIYSDHHHLAIRRSSHNSMLAAGGMYYWRISVHQQRMNKLRAMDPN